MGDSLKEVLIILAVLYFECLFGISYGEVVWCIKNYYIIDIRFVYAFEITQFSFAYPATLVYSLSFHNK